MVRPVRPAKAKGISRRCCMTGAVVFVVLFLLYEEVEDTLYLIGEQWEPTEAPTPSSQHNEQLTPPKEQGHRVASLDCAPFGGPLSHTAVDEMVYWRDIPTDATFTSPYAQQDEELYFTFEPDEGGWNNIRMAMETAVALAVSMGRTLVLPPRMKLYLLWHGGSLEKDTMSFHDFFHVDSISKEHAAHGGLKVISFREFLEREAANFVDMTTGLPSAIPENRTDWDGAAMNFQGTSAGGGKVLWEWVRTVTTILPWSFDKCVVALPARPGPDAAEHMKDYLAQVKARDDANYPDAQGQKWRQRRNSYNGQPTPVNASATDRLAELLAHRNQLCIYDDNLQRAKVVHALGETRTGFRLLIHFYAFLFFEDWKQDVWIKRFIRDHFRYLDEIQCGAARVVEQVRKRASERNNGVDRFDSFHIRRGDFQYLDTRLPAEEIYAENARLFIPDGRTVFVATDEGNRTFFDPLREHYDLVFLDNFTDQIKDISPNYYGMLDQLIASRGDTFMGAFFSTFTGYINRMRGYQAQRRKLSGYEEGLIESYYYVPSRLAHMRNVMRTYGAVQPAFWQQEFHVAWRDLDHNVDASATKR